MSTTVPVECERPAGKGVSSTYSTDEQRRGATQMRDFATGVNPIGAQAHAAQAEALRRGCQLPVSRPDESRRQPGAGQEVDVDAAQAAAVQMLVVNQSQHFRQAKLKPAA